MGVTGCVGVIELWKYSGTYGKFHTSNTNRTPYLNSKVDTYVEGYLDWLLESGIIYYEGKAVKWYMYGYMDLVQVYGESRCIFQSIGGLKTI